MATLVRRERPKGGLTAWIMEPPLPVATVLKAFEAIAFMVSAAAKFGMRTHVSPSIEKSATPESPTMVQPPFDLAMPR